MTSFKEAKQEALEFLRNQSVGVVATVDSSGQPFASAVYYHCGEEFNIFFLTTKSTHKSLNIKTNDKIAFSVGTGPEYISVMIRGRVVIPDSDEQDRVLPSLLDKPDKNSGFDWPVRKLVDLKGQNLALYKIVPDKVTFLNINSKQEPKSAADYLYHLMN